MARTTTKQTTVRTALGETIASGRQDNLGKAGVDAHIVILKSGDGFFGIDINLVQEIVLSQDITLVPGAAGYIAGMTDLRGRVIPVAAFAGLLGQEVGEQNDETRILVVEHGSGHIGFIVDAVTEVMMVDGEQIEDAGATIGTQQHDFILGVAKLEDTLVSLVDVRRLLTSNDKAETLERAA